MRHLRDDLRTRFLSTHDHIFILGLVLHVQLYPPNSAASLQPLHAAARVAGRFAKFSPELQAAFSKAATADYREWYDRQRTTARGGTPPREVHPLLI